ncbi:hypothetical protein N8D25_16680 (plasmid) [Enterococcus faecium]
MEKKLSIITGNIEKGGTGKTTIPILQVDMLSKILGMKVLQQR